jgi:MPBQ/MSBQ methyltransferase
VNTGEEHLNAWDRDYRRRGHLWGGNPSDLPDLPEMTEVLELGCGTGRNIRGMVTKGWIITALDCSLRAISLCGAGLHGSPAVRFVTGDVRHLPFRNATFSAVFATHTGGHLLAGEREQMACEISRALRPGGHVFFRDFGTGDFRCGKGDLIEDSTYLRGHGSVTHYFTDDEVRELFSMLNLVSVTHHCRVLRVRGRDYLRDEIGAVFEKKELS